MDSLTFDTTFLIDFQRERNAKPAAAHAFLERHAEDIAFLPVVVCGEFGEGFSSASDPVYRSVVDSFELLPVTARVAAVYARITRHLRGHGILIGTNDLWIAATALDQGSPLVTRDTRHFARVPDLRTVSY